jgi:hypothetical protein
VGSTAEAESVEGHPRPPDPSGGTQEQPASTARGAVEPMAPRQPLYQPAALLITHSRGTVYIACIG